MDEEFEARREANRKAMPAVARVVDEFRAAFGDIEVIAVADRTTGRTQGTFETFCDVCDVNNCDRPEVLCGHKLATRQDRLPMEFYHKKGRQP